MPRKQPIKPEDYILNVEKEGPREKEDWEYPITASTTKKYPKKFQRKIISTVINQGSIGSCVGCSGTIALEDNPGNKGKRFSPNFIYQNAKLYDIWPGEDYSGTSISGACKALLKHGCCTSREWPYRSSESSKPRNMSKAIKVANGYKLHAYFKVNPKDENQMRELLQKECLWAAIGIRSKFYDAGSTGEVWEKGYMKSANKGGHAITVIGWDTRDGKLGWICRNSWGYRWGSRGNFWIEDSLWKQIVFPGMYYLVTKPEEAGELIDVKKKPKKKKKKFKWFSWFRRRR